MAKHAPQRIQSANRAHPHFIRPTAVALAVAACFSGQVLANPTNPIPIAGIQQIQGLGTSALTITTNANRSIINWGSFSIDVNELTKFIQPSALSAVLNRVTGQDPSAILGALQSNGRVFLLNPNGIVFGAGSQINVAGLVASTLKMSDDDFLNNRMKFTDGAGADKLGVVNNGSITGGSVYLIGNAVTNNGLIASPNGEVVLAAGNSVELVNPGTPDLRVEIVAPGNEARNLGTITAEAGRIGIYAGLITQSGTISADSAVSEGGRIVLKSTKKTTLEAGSLTSARGTDGGQIIALSGMTDGVTEVAGKIDASATAGNGGFIETSAARVQVADSAVITTQGGNGGQSGTWLIDPLDIIIGTDISAATLQTALGSSSVVIDTYGGSSFYGGEGNPSGVGNITVDEAVSWAYGSSLTLTAQNNITVNQQIRNTGTGGINLYAGWDGVTPSTSPSIVTGTGAITLNAPVKTAGEIQLLAGGDILQNTGGSIEAAGLLAKSPGGSVNLANPGATNIVGVLAGEGKGQFAFRNSGNLTIGSVGLVNGITVDNSSVGNGRNATINVEVAGGSLTVIQPVYARGGDGGEGQAGGNATVTMSGSTINVNGVSVLAQGGQSGAYSFSSGGGGANGGNAVMTLTTSGAGGTTINGGTLTVQGGQGGNGAGNNFSGGSGGNGGHGGDAALTVTANGGGLIRVENTGSVNVRGGDGGNGGYGGSGSVEGNPNGGNGGVGGNGGIANATFVTNGGGNIEIITGGSIAVTGGEGGSGGNGGGGSAFGGNGGNGGNGGTANAWLTANGSNIVVSSSSITVSGGSGSSGGNGGYGYSGNGGNGGNGGHGADALLDIRATGGGAINVAYGGNISVYGGSGSSGSNGGGTALGLPGMRGNGGNGGNAILLLSAGSGGLNVAAGASLQAFGGSGSYGYVGGRGGNATITLTSAGDMNVAGQVQAYGGSGGTESSAAGGRGGDATITLTSTGNMSVTGQVQAHGGSGGSASSGTGNIGIGGAGGNATIALTSTGNMTVSGQVQAYGGDGSYGSGVGGRGGDASVELNSSSTLDVTPGATIYADGGEGYSTTGGNANLLVKSGGGLTISGASVYTHGGSGYSGNGGNANTTIQSTGGDVLIDGSYGGSINANGGSPYYSATGNGGNGVVFIGSAGLTTITNAGIYASGGSAYAYGGTVNGGNASIQIQAGGGLTVSNSMITASGGYVGGSGQGGAAGLTILAGGNIQFEGAEGRVYGGGSNAVGGDAGILMVAGGNIVMDSSLFPGSYDTLSAVGGGNTPGTKSVVVAAAGDVSLINGASVYSSGMVGLGGANISLANGSYIEGYGNTYITTGGNVNVDNSHILGSPDVFMTVGGVVNMDNAGTIEADAPTTIHLTFPMLTSGGYFVNGIEGVVYDELTLTGFLADLSPAILGTNLLVTYGGGATLNIPTDTLIVAMGESTKPPDPDKDKNIFKETEEDKKKDAPVCR